ncbi:zinc-ribbon domain-containing protein [Dyadobacter sp. CY312]|uniref:zinc-ribbon domain-containing protein n=1 Tax=Dyadobacter sp. CY312 TaxID=2907303 RepID=UPI001F248FD6|nr:zinc-ribbon domain-containing protein [Dyadobacter sp. CY312]MCE7040148.1 zinc ribbon domain-containing protein [Dyadobacter sp. CY312]
MVIFGLRSTTIASLNSQLQCRHCHTNESVWLYIYRHYFHIFWIPAFPLWKSAASQCTHCKQVLTNNEFDDELKQAKTEAVKIAKTPIWTFSWLLVGAAIVALLTISSLLNS